MRGLNIWPHLASESQKIEKNILWNDGKFNDFYRNMECSLTVFWISNKIKRKNNKKLREIKIWNIPDFKQFPAFRK